MVASNDNKLKLLNPRPIAYLAFTFTWFECAQFTHLAWWALCLTQISPEKRSRGSIQQRVPQQAVLHPKDVTPREMSP